MPFKSWAAAVAAGLLAACGGGGGGGSPAPAPPHAVSTSEVSLSVAASGVPVAGGTSTRINLTVSNAGPDPATNLVLTSRLGARLAAGSVSCVASGGAVCPAHLASTVGVPSLPAGGMLTFELTAWVAVDFSGAIRSTPSVTADNDRTPGNNTIAFDIVAYSADVRVSATGPTQAVDAGSVATYAVSVTNAGPDAAHDVLIANSLNAAQAIGAVSCTASGGATCPASLGASMAVPVLPAQGSLAFTVPATVPAGASGSLVDVVTVTSAGDPLVGNNLATAQGQVTVPPPPSLPTGVSSVELQSEFGDYVGEGRSHAYTRADSILTVVPDGRRLSVSIKGDQWWFGEFHLPSAVTRFEPGTYQNLGRYSGLATPSGSLSWSGEGRGCNTLVGTLIVNSATYQVEQLVAIDLSFIQHCEGRTAALRGRVRWSAGDPTVPPGPLTPPPTGLWMPDIAPTSVSYIYLESDPGDFVGDGGAYGYTKANAGLTVSVSGGEVRVGVDGDERWSGTFAVMDTLAGLQPGYYGNLQRHPFHNPTKGGLTWSGEGRGCNKLTGWFVVDSVSHVNGSLSHLVMRFEQHCEGSVPALRGKIHWVASDTTAPPGPVSPPPTGLWAPPAGATPATGNYVYLVSDTGDFVGQGQTTLHTPADATFSISALKNHLAVNLVGLARGEFRGMNTLAQLQPGYYPDLQRYPFHNPTKGGLAWITGSRGCNVVSGWFVVDSVAYSNGSIDAIDLRFEQHCEGVAAALRGKVHWVR